MNPLEDVGRMSGGTLAIYGTLDSLLGRSARRNSMDVKLKVGFSVYCGSDAVPRGTLR
jgi:formylmethanofuran dehydrogenase subunit C